jgi:outer membrane protein assembly factor BamB/predicted phosphodiesterase
MKQLFLFGWLLLAGTAIAQVKPFRFAFISDTHIGSPNGAAEEDLRRTVQDINSMNDVAFVVITGDITELGTNEELKRAKQLFDSLDIPYYIIPGNHDTGWSESGGAMFATVFGYDKFSFEFEGIRFLGCPSGPYVRMSDGHVPRDAVNWLDTELKKLKPGQPVIFLNHYPIDNGLDNWYEITDRFRQYNTWAILCGHGHSNRAMNFEDIPGVMGRSNLRAKAAVGGYNLVDLRSDSMLFTERRPGIETLKTWTGVKIETHHYDVNKKFTRPDYSVNQQQPVKIDASIFAEPANVISTPALSGEYIVSGNQAGEVVTRYKGKPLWKQQTNGAIFSSPAIRDNKVIIGSADSSIYCFDLRKGTIVWKKTTGAAVLGSPLINGDTVFIGGSDHSYLALALSSGKTIWKFDGLNGPVVSTPLLYDGKLIFGAWDRNLYAVKSATGELVWKWNNGSTVRNYSPASCTPVAANGVVYIVAPDRYITALDASNGTVLWRNNDGGVRESIGISSDGKWIYGKSMQDTIVAYAASREKQTAAWKMHCGFGYEHVPSMLIEKEGKVYFGTRNGVVYCIDPVQKKTIWQFKIDNSMVNTVNVISSKRVIAATMDGKIADLRVK